MFSYWRYKIEQAKDGLNNILNLIRPRSKSVTLILQSVDATKKCSKEVSALPVITFKCKKNDMIELISQVFTENKNLIRLLKPIIAQLNESSLHTIYGALIENVTIIVKLIKVIEDDVQLKEILSYANVLMVNMLNCMNIEDCCKIVPNKPQNAMNFICLKFERYINHLQVLISLLTSAEMKPLLPCVSEPAILSLKSPDKIVHRNCENRAGYSGKQQLNNETEFQIPRDRLRKLSGNRRKTQ